MKIAVLIAPLRSSLWPLLTTIFVLALFFTLSVRAHDQFHWSDWEFGDAQTMLSLRQWQEGGWLKNRLLFNPHGYAKITPLLDRQELRHHAHGISPTSSPEVGPRLLYTHYPAGYLIPYALLFRLGFDQIFALRLLSLLFSCGALVLMYNLFARLAAPRVAFLAILFYAGSTSFLGYADTLANQPLDDLLRFGFLLAVVVATATDRPSRRRFMLLTAWLLEFFLSLSSFDSVFFLFIWLVGWDLVAGKGWRWRLYLLFALAPLSAHGLQFCQNVWYLGWHDALQDILGTYIAKSYTPDGNPPGNLIAHAFTNCFALIYNPALLFLPIPILYPLGLRWLPEAERQSLPKIKLLILLFLCGLAFLLLLPHAAHMSYEGRQMIPFTSLLVSGFTWEVVAGWHRRGLGSEKPTRGRASHGFLRQSYLLVASLVLFLFWSGFIVLNRHQEETPEYLTDLLLARELGTISTAHDPVYFNLFGFDNFLNPEYQPGYPQIQPLTEFYADSRPILSFNHPALLAEDLITLTRLGGENFSPVVVTDSQERMTSIVNYLFLKGLLLTSPDAFTLQRNKFYLDLTPYIQWRTPK